MFSSRPISLSRVFILLAGLALAGSVLSQDMGYASEPTSTNGGNSKNTNIPVVQKTRNPRDPLEDFNRSMYQFNEGVDKAIFKPLAKTYNYILPEPARKMVSNFFGNLFDIRTTINDLLQLKFEQAANDAGRVIINSTFGVLGLFDVADHLEKHDEDFGQTLGYWGVGSGPYLVLPILGPINIRDTAGLAVDFSTNLNPIGWLDNVAVRNTMYGTLWVDMRADLLDDENILEEAAIDRYAFIRDAYMQRRQNLVYDGDPPREKFDDEEFDDEEDNAQSGTSTQTDSSSDGQEAGQPKATDPAAADVSIILTLPEEMKQPAQPAATDAAASPPSFYQTAPLNQPDR